MTKLKVLVEGYAREFDDHEEVSPSVVLIDNGKSKIIVDPGCDRRAMLDALAAQGLTTGQIDIVLLTHTHLDHCILAGMFENASVLDDSDIYPQNSQIRRQDETTLGPDIQTVSTPGHDQFHCSVIVKTEDMDKVVVAGDIFWWLDGEEPAKDIDALLNLEDPYVKDEAALRDSRIKILEIADYIIPGHGKMFKVERQIVTLQ